MGARGFSDRGVKVKNATEEERLGLVTGDSRSMPALPHYDEDSDDLNDDEDDDVSLDDKRTGRYGRGITSSPPRRGSEEGDDKAAETTVYGANRGRWNESRNASRDDTARSSPPRPPPYRRDAPFGGDDDEAFL
jgi:hypothetical protein